MEGKAISFTSLAYPSIFNGGPVVVFRKGHVYTSSVAPIEAHLTKNAIIIITYWRVTD